jgi:Uma2 family endonuclease
MNAAHKLHYSYGEYLNVLENSEVKLEYADGVIYAMAGGTPAHGALGAAAVRVLGQALLGRCTVFSSDVKIRSDAQNRSVFPDGSVVCGEFQRSPTDAQAVTNPSIVVEVTSKSTEEYDRGDKLALYQSLPSVRAILLISHREAHVTLVQRSGAQWTTSELRAGDIVGIDDPQVRFPVDELFAGIPLDRA